MKNLKQLRMQMGLSQQTLAEKFNLSQQSIYKYENGLAEPDISTLKAFSDFFDVSIDYLVGAVPEENSQKKQASINLSKEESAMIKKVRKLNPEVKKSVFILIDHL